MAGHAAILGGGLGVMYGLSSLEAVSPLGLWLLLWGGLILYVAWRIPLQRRNVGWTAGGLVVGFGGVWAVVGAQSAATCHPPSCVSANATTTGLEGVAFLAPVLLLAGVALAWRNRRSRQRG